MKKTSLLGFFKSAQALFHGWIPPHKKKKILDQQEALLELAMDASAHAVMVTNAAGDILYRNRNLLRIAHLPEDALDNQSWQEALASSMKDPDRLLRFVRQIFEQGIGETLDIYELKDGGLLECRTRFEELDGVQGGCRVWCFIDCTEQQRRERELTHLGMHDTLTGSYNRAFFELRLRQLRLINMYPVCMFMIDVDGLKKINDHHGHPAGDQLLCQVASVLHQACRTEDVVARLGGDEFGVLLVRSDVETAEQVLSRVHGLLNLYNIRHSEVSISLSIGYAIANNAREMEDLVARADETMYELRRKRRSSLHIAT